MTSTFTEPAKAAVLLFAAAIVQVSIVSSATLLGGRPDLLLITLVLVALLRGSIVGAAGGFGAGLVIDTANLGTLGVTSLLLTIAGYWIGRYGETTGRDRTHAPFLSVGVVTILYALAALALHFVLGERAPARVILLERLPPEVLFNLFLTLPVYAIVRRLVRPMDRSERAQEVHLLV
jgi:rod shape-determining protein MreD